MRTPIAYTLGWPDRISAPAPRLDFAEIGQLTFERPDLARFPALKLAYEALEAGGAAPTILNAANEIAVSGFLDSRIGFLDIARVVDRTLETVPHVDLSTLELVGQVDAEARAAATGIVQSASSLH